MLGYVPCVMLGYFVLGCVPYVRLGYFVLGFALGWDTLC